MRLGAAAYQFGVARHFESKTSHNDPSSMHLGPGERDRGAEPWHGEAMRSLKDRQRQDSLAESDNRDLVSRSDKRKIRVTAEEGLKELALSLVGLKPKNLKRIELPDYVVESIDKARSFKSAKARNRQVLVVRQHLREIDAEAVHVAVTDILFPPVRKAPATAAASVAVAAANGQGPASAEALGAAPDDRDNRIDIWEQRLLQEGDGALGRLLAQYPHANRQGLRQLLRTVRKASAAMSESAAPETGDCSAQLASQAHATFLICKAAHKRSALKLRASLNSLIR